MSRLRTNADEVRHMRRALRQAITHGGQTHTRVCMSPATAERLRSITATLSALADELNDLEADAELYIARLVRSRQAARRRAA